MYVSDSKNDSGTVGDSGSQTASELNAAEKAESVAVVSKVMRRIGETSHSEVGGAYMVCPDKRFISMQDDETVALLLRAHPVTNVGWITMALIMLIIPEVILALGMLGTVPIRMMFIGRLAWYLFVLGYSFEKFLYWYYSVVIVTNERAIDIDFVNLLQREISYAALNHIEEPSMVSGGLLRSMFHYGDVFIATAAEGPAVEGRNVPFPDRAVRIISELAEELEEKRGRGGKP